MGKPIKKQTADKKMKFIIIAEPRVLNNPFIELTSRAIIRLYPSYSGMRIVTGKQIGRAHV